MLQCATILVCVDPVPTHTRTKTHTHKNICTHRNTRARTHAHTHTPHTTHHTHTHTHTPYPSVSSKINDELNLINRIYSTQYIEPFLCIILYYTHTSPTANDPYGVNDKQTTRAIIKPHRSH